jgi:hypothetical protein
MKPLKCFSDPYAHWISDAYKANSSKSAANRFVSADLVPIVLEGTKRDQLANIIQELELKEQGSGRHYDGSGFASLLIRTEYAKRWLGTFESLHIPYEIGAPFASPAAIIDPLRMTERGLQQANDSAGRPSLPKSSKKKIIGVIDYGCAFANEKFCKLVNGNRSTRVFAIWDQHQRGPAASATLQGYQTLSWKETPEFGYGVQARRDWPAEAHEVGLNSFLQQFDRAGYFDDALCYQYANYPSLDFREATHGTYIMDFAAGVPSPLKGLTTDWAVGNDDAVEKADVVFVQLPRSFQGEQVSGVLRTYVLDAIQYILDSANDDADVVINLSYGGLAGPHEGSSLIERAIDGLVDSRSFRANSVTTEIVVCSGNSASSDMHAFLRVPAQSNRAPPASVELSVIPDNPSLQFVEMWIDPYGPADLDATPAVISVLLPNGICALSNKTLDIGVNETHVLQDSSGVTIGKICLPKRLKSGVGNGGYRVLIGINPTALVMSQTLADKEGLAPIGIWKIQLENIRSTPLSWSGWCERHDPTFGSGHGPRQIKFANETSLLCTNSNLSTTQGKRIIVGGSILNAPDFMAEYTGRGPFRSLERLAEQDEIDPHVVYAPSEENLGYWALAGAGVLGQSKVRYSGTSVAAGVVTRALISGMTVDSLNLIKKPTHSRQVFP